MRMEDDLSRTLRLQLSRTVEQRERVDVLDDALAAALVVGDGERAWALVRLAAGLRARGDFDRALLALDGADLLGDDAARAAAFTCAAAVHHDRGDLPRAREAGERARSLRESEHVLSVLASVYYDLWCDTRLDEFRARWREVADRLPASKT